MNDYSRQEWQRGDRVQGTQNCPTRAWRGRGGRILGRNYWGSYWRVQWDHNRTRSLVNPIYLEPEIMHRAW